MTNPFSLRSPTAAAGRASTGRNLEVEAYLDGEQRQANTDFEAIIEAIIDKARKGQSGKHSQQPQPEELSVSRAARSPQRAIEASAPGSTVSPARAEQISASIESSRDEVRSVTRSSGPSSGDFADKVAALGESIGRNRGLMEYM